MTQAMRRLNGRVRIALVNMPFACLDVPSLGLLQLQALVRREFNEDIAVEVCAANIDFGKFLGTALYQEIALHGEHLYTGLGDWLFRQVAYPELPDNIDRYFQRFYPKSESRDVSFRAFIAERRAQVDNALDELIDRHQLADVDLVGFTSMFAQSVACFALARKLKLRNPSVVTVMGGANCEGVMGRTIAARVPEIDFVCSGSGLRSFPELLRRLFFDHNGRSTPIAGVFARRGDAILEAIAPATSVDLGDEVALDEMAQVDYMPFLETMAAAFPEGDVRPVLTFETSRGCWWGQKAHCTFCGLNGTTMQYRSLSTERALEQFARLFRHVPPVTELRCVDNILPKHFVTEVLAHLDPPHDVKIFYEVKADLTDDDLRVLSRAGVREVQPGIEALATSTLKLMRKGSSAFTNLRFLMSCAVHSVAPMWNLLLGFPGETRGIFEKYIQDIPHLSHLRPPAGAYPVRFDRFSPYFESQKPYGLLLRPLDMYRFTHPFEADILADLAYYFGDYCDDPPYRSAMLSMLGPVQSTVAHWRMRYAGLDGGVPAELFVVPESGGNRVFDSRDGEVREHALTELEVRALTLLSRPVGPGFPDGAQGMPGLPDAIESLNQRGLLFVEDGRAMSIVLPSPSGRFVRAMSTSTRT
jgi:magnesium-protoporphyrin IX monomethyl ester (oxidative) cyclase